MATIITLTNRPPVWIEDGNWPLVATASEKQHDGQVGYQPKRISKWFLGVRQHADGRAIVYAVYRYTSHRRGARCYGAKAGILLNAADTPAICDAICEVSGVIAAAECAENDAARWPSLAAQCIADMPADVL